MKPSASQQPKDKESFPGIAIVSRSGNYAPTGSIAMVNNSYSTSNSNASPNNPSSSSDADADANAVHNDKQVDSALLSALRDKRERMALLRLEKNLIEFMNDKNCGFMEVGGAGNSTVIRGASGGSGSGSGPNSPDADNGNVVARGQVNGMNVYNGNDGGVGRQTSFQRLCLHRLADRFNIVREQGYNNPNNHTNNNPALIRLVKVKESRIPSVKLIDLDLTQYEQSPPQDRGEGFGGAGVMGIADRLGMTQLQEGGGGKKSKKKEKVKIMKRSSSSNQIGNEQKLNASKRKGKKLSDKEKAYAEARARIFNSAKSSPNASNIDGSDHAAVVNNTTHSSNPDDSSPGSSRSATTSPVPVLGKSAAPLDESELVTLVPSQLSSAGAGGPNAPKDRKQNRSNLPAAATGGGASKVTWRNREQEASDPDFQRRHHPGMIQQMPMHPQYHPYAQNGMLGNGYGHHTHANAGGYGYGVAGDGQMYNHGHHDSGLGMYTPAPSSHYQANGSWHPYEPQLQHHHRSQNEYQTPTVGGVNQDHVSKADIDLSREEFPALR